MASPPLSDTVQALLTPPPLSEKRTLPAAFLPLSLRDTDAFAVLVEPYTAIERESESFVVVPTVSG